MITELVPKHLVWACCSICTFAFPVCGGARRFLDHGAFVHSEVFCFSNNLSLNINTLFTFSLFTTATFIKICMLVHIGITTITAVRTFLETLNVSSHDPHLMAITAPRIKRLIINSILKHLCSLHSLLLLIQLFHSSEAVMLLFFSSGELHATFLTDHLNCGTNFQMI